MPTYDYKCLHCGKVSEMKQFNVEMADLAVISCSDCPFGPSGGSIMVRQPCAPNFTIKGAYTAKTGYSGSK